MATLDDNDCVGSDDDSDDDEEEDEETKRYAFPELDARIRSAIAEYGAVFPKLNFSSPKVRLLHWLNI